MKILALTTSRADREPLMPVINALGKSCTHVHLENGIFNAWKNIKPDMVLLLGDQYLTLKNATEAANRAIPISHIHGGEETLGAVDNAFRHAISKLAYWHFPSCSLHAKRIEQMGESPDRIFALGAPGVDALAETHDPITIPFSRPFSLVCYHPETLGHDTANIFRIQAIIQRYRISFVSGCNNDIGNESVTNALKCLVPTVFYQTYDNPTWIQLMREADALIGNSSGFIIEGMTLQQMRGGKPEIIIIGDRQKGRYEEAKELFATQQFPFGKPGTVAPAIAKKLLKLGIPDRPRKVFYVK